MSLVDRAKAAARDRVESSNSFSDDRAYLATYFFRIDPVTPDDLHYTGFRDRKRFFALKVERLRFRLTLDADDRSVDIEVWVRKHWFRVADLADLGEVLLGG